MSVEALLQHSTFTFRFHLFHILCQYRVCFSQKDGRKVHVASFAELSSFSYDPFLYHFPSSEPKISLLVTQKS
jgi:hypothetical protein